MIGQEGKCRLLQVVRKSFSNTKPIGHERVINVLLSTERTKSFLDDDTWFDFTLFFHYIHTHTHIIYRLHFFERFFEVEFNYLSSRSFFFLSLCLLFFSFLLLLPFCSCFSFFSFYFFEPQSHERMYQKISRERYDRDWLFWTMNRNYFIIRLKIIQIDWFDKEGGGNSQ